LIKHFKLTSDSRPKLIDLIDATGAGNVDISTVKNVDADGYIQGLTGRKLKVFNILIRRYKFTPKNYIFNLRYRITGRIHLVNTRLE